MVEKYDFKEISSKILSNLDSPFIVGLMLDHLHNELTALQKQLKQSQKEIKTLQDTNMKLYQSKENHPTNGTEII